MKAETIFSSASAVAMIGWLLLAVGPRWRVTHVLIRSGLIPILLSAAYAILIVLYFGAAEGGFDSLANVMKLFTNEWAVLAGWLHYLAFDLLVGIWEVKDAAEHGISHWLVVPCLFFTLMLGPVGFLLYLLIRTVAGRRNAV